MNPVLCVKYFLYDISSSGVLQTPLIEDLTFLVSLYLLESDSPTLPSMAPKNVL